MEKDYKAMWEELKKRLNQMHEMHENDLCNGNMTSDHLMKERVSAHTVAGVIDEMAYLEQGEVVKVEF